MSNKISTSHSTKEQRHEYYLRNKEAIKKKATQWRKDNPEKFATARRKREMLNKHTPRFIYKALKNNHKRRKYKYMCSFVEFEQWYLDQTQNCIYCGVSSDKFQQYYPGERLQIERLNNDESYIVGNMALACKICNKVKSNILTIDEMMKIGKVIGRRWE